jgi:hypothetical protein
MLRIRRLVQRAVLVLLRRAEREFTALELDLNATCREPPPFLSELLSPTMATSRPILAWDTPSLSANAAGVFSAKSICTFFATLVLRLSYTPASHFPRCSSPSWPFLERRFTPSTNSFAILFVTAPVGGYLWIDADAPGGVKDRTGMTNHVSSGTI